MKVAVSNLSWNIEENERVISFLEKEHIQGIEVVPAKIASSQTPIPWGVFAQFKQRIAAAGLKIISLQSILFGKPELQLFSWSSARAHMFEHLKNVIEIAGFLEAPVIVFGSPKNRNLMGRSPQEAKKIAVEFFRELGRYSVRYHTKICIEPNPLAYSCDFLTNSSQASQLVRQIDSEGIGLHLDSSCMYLSGEDYKAAIPNVIDILEHFHVSEPNLKDFSQPIIDHAAIASLLKLAGYSKWVSIEMLPTEKCLDSVREALDFVVRTYGEPSSV